MQKCPNRDILFSPRIVTIDGAQYDFKILKNAFALSTRKNEHLFTTKNQKIIDRAKGEVDSVELYADFIGKDTYHNHPSKSPPSLLDYQSYIQSGEKRMHVMIKKGMYYFEIPNRPQIEILDLKDVYNHSDFKKITKEVNDDFLGHQTYLKSWNEILATAKKEGWIAGLKKWEEIIPDVTKVIKSRGKISPKKTLPCAENIEKKTK